MRAAFFDLDRTVIARSSSLALAPAFRRRGLIGRRDLARAGAAQLAFAVRGAGGNAGRRMAEHGMAVLAGLPVHEVRELVEEALRGELLPLVHRGALELIRRHRSRGERVYLLSASLDQIVTRLGDELGFHGAVGSTCATDDGVYTGRLEWLCYGEEKARAARRLARADGIDLAASAAYSDSHSDLPFLEVVGRPVAVNPDRGLRRVAAARGWPVVRLRRRAVPPQRATCGCIPSGLSSVSRAGNVLEKGVPS